jgi:hypothetical protein
MGRIAVSGSVDNAIDLTVLSSSSQPVAAGVRTEIGASYLELRALVVAGG